MTTHTVHLSETLREYLHGLVVEEYRRTPAGTMFEARARELAALLCAADIDLHVPAKTAHQWHTSGARLFQMAPIF